MALEDLTGNKYIDSLNSDWPAGTDLPGAGDDHIRGLKNVLKRTFPNLSGPVTRTQTDINNGTVPAASCLPFYNPAAPTGWERVTGLENTYALRIVKTADAGQKSGGSHDPVLNDKVPDHGHSVPAVYTNTETQDHSHYVSLNTGNESADHSHTGYTNTTGGHNHTENGWQAGVSGAAYGTGWGPADRSSGWAGDHSHSVQTYGRSAAHYHYVGGSSGGRSAAHNHYIAARNTGSPTGSNAMNWTPRYLDVILCQKK
jgi:hypothetical protein